MFTWEELSQISSSAQIGSAESMVSFTSLSLSITFLFSCNQVVVLHAIDRDRMKFLDSQTCSWSVLSKCCNSELQAGHAFQLILAHSGLSQLGIAVKH